MITYQTSYTLTDYFPPVLCDVSFFSKPGALMFHTKNEYRISYKRWVIWYWKFSRLRDFGEYNRWGVFLNCSNLSRNTSPLFGSFLVCNRTSYSDDTTFLKWSSTGIQHWISLPGASTAPTVCFGEVFYACREDLPDKSRHIFLRYHMISLNFRTWSPHVLHKKWSIHFEEKDGII